MNCYIKNFFDLFSDDENILYQALIEKKDWILKEFYLVFNFENVEDLDAIAQGHLRFKKLLIDPNIFSGDNKKTSLINEKFNENYRVLYLDDAMPVFDSENEFCIKFDFNKLSDREYKILFANFYPCVDEKVIIENYHGDEMSLLMLSMNRLIGDNVLIMDKTYLTEKDEFACNVVSKVIYNSKLQERFKTVLMSLKDLLCIDFEEVEDVNENTI